MLYFIVINLMALIIYGIDKKRAVKGKWRISEKALIGIAIFGGSLGALVGMHVFHHKTRKWKFKIVIPILLLIHIIILIIFIFS